MKKIWKRPDKLVTAAAALFVAALTSVLFFYAASSMGEIRTSEHFIIESDTLSIGGTPETSSSFNSEGSAGQALTGTGESANYKLFGGFEETLNSTPDSPSSLSQNTVGGTTIETGGWIPPGTVVIKFDMYDPDSSDILTPQVELRPTTESFTGSPTYAGADVSFGGSTVEGVITIEGLAPGTYHWRVRVLDAGMLSSSWVSYGGNPETAKDLWVKGYGFISGTATLSGEADNSGTLIEAFDSGTVWGSTETASDGSYLLQVLEGTYSIEATKPGFEMQDFPAPEVISPYSTVEGIDFALPGAWPMFTQDRWHTGNSPDNIITTPLTLRWSYTLGSYYLVYSNPAEVNGRLFVGGYDGNVYAFNARTGTFLWSYPTGKEIQGSPAVANANVFIGNENGKVVSLDEATGTLKWSNMLAGSVIGSCNVAHGRIYLGTLLSGGVYALDEHTGKILWSYPLTNAIESTPAVNDNKVFIGCLDHNLYALDEASGSLVWSFDSGNMIGYSSPLVHGGRVYVGSVANLCAVDENSGGFVWSYHAAGAVIDSSPSEHNGRIFFGARGTASAYAINESDGTLAWSFRAAAGDVESPLTVANGNVYFGGGPTLYVVDEATGTCKWSYLVNPPWAIYSAPTVYQNRLYFDSWNTKVYCFENDVSPESPSSLMQYRYDGVTVIPTGEWTNKGKVIFKMTMDDLNDFDELYPEVELRLTSEAFIGVPTSTGEGILRSGEAVTGITTVDGIASGLYHWQARVRDSIGWNSGWIAFGGNPETQPDFKMDASPPAVTVTKPVANCIVMAGTATEINWIVTEEGGSGLITGPITLYYSINNGVTWELIASNETNDGSYVWTAPWVSSANFRISVEAEDNAGNVGMGVSNKFSVLRPGWIKGTVTLSGETDHSGTLVEAFDSGTVWGSAETASDGSYLIQVFEGTYSLEATKSGFEIKDYPSAVTVPPVSTVEGVDLVLPGAWPMFKQDRWHTGDSPDKIINTPLAMRWSYTTGGYVYSNPAVVNSKLFVGGFDNNIYALDAGTGSFIWSYPTDSRMYSSPSIMNGMVFIGNEGGKFYAIDEDTGQLKWSKAGTGNYIIGSSTVAHNRVYFGSGYNMVALDQYTGSMVWSYQAGDSDTYPVYSTPAIVDGKVFFGCWNYNVYALDEAKGSLIWSYHTSAMIDYSSPAVHNGRVFVGSHDKNLYCLDENTGDLIWSYQTIGGIGSSPSIHAGKVFVGSWGGAMYAVDEVSGSLDWSYPVSGDIYGAPTVANGNVFFGTRLAKMIGLDEDTGSFKWSHSGAWTVWGEPSTYGNRLYYGSWDKNVYCFENNVTPDAPSILRQFQSDNMTEIPTGGWTNNVAFFWMQMSDPNDYDTLYPEVEVVPTSTSFTHSPNVSGAGVVYEASPVEGTAEVIGLVNMQGYHWQARVRDFAGFTSPWVSFGGNPEGNADFVADTITPETPAPFDATALPASSPTYVSLVWGIVTDESPGSELAGYNMYRSSSHGSGYAKMNSAFLTSTSTNDASVAFGNNYFYVVTARDNAGNESQYSTESSPPNLVVTKTMTIEAPKLGGYSGGPTDAVPGSTLTYRMIYVNNGFAPGSSIVVVDKIPPHTEYKLESATGEGITSVLFSDDYGATYVYIPSGTLVDGNVTNIKWNLANITIGASAEASFKVVIQ